MARPLFNQIVNEVTNHDAFFHNKIDCTGREGISGLIKCTSVIRQLAYGVNVDFLDEYMQISERTSPTTLDHFCQDVMDIYGPDYLRKPTLLRCKTYVYDMLSLVLLGRTTTSTFYINLLLFNDLKTGRAPEIPFVVNGVTYPCGYYLVDEIYPKLVALVKTISEPADDDHKRILYKQKQESARKDVERAFGVLKKKWAY
ncbi:ALP1-like protein isoform X1 [Tanacetum coccineum]